MLPSLDSAHVVNWRLIFEVANVKIYTAFQETLG